MRKLKETMGKVKNAFRNVVTLPDMVSETYTQLGIYDEGEICIMPTPDRTFLQNVVDTFALIREIHGAPSGTVGMGITTYHVNSVDYDLAPITELSTWQAIVENGFADCLQDKEDNALRYVLKSKHPIDPAVFDLLYEAYPETKLVDMLHRCERLEAAKWVDAHGGDKYYDGLRYPMKTIMAMSRNYEAKEIFKYLYDCEQEEYVKVVKEERAAAKRAAAVAQ